ncbi:MAG: hypothetical protein ACLUSV_01865 [Streptococcus sp.]
MTYDFKVAEKVAADAANAKSEADYKVQLAVYETAKKNYKQLWLSIRKIKQNMMLRRKPMMLK